MITAPVNHIICSTRVTSQTQFINIGNTRCIIFNSFPINVIDSADLKCVHRVNGMCVVDPCVVDLSTTEFPLRQWYNNTTFVGRFYIKRNFHNPIHLVTGIVSAKRVETLILINYLVGHATSTVALSDLWMCYRIKWVLSITLNIFSQR